MGGGAKIYLRNIAKMPENKELFSLYFTPIVLDPLVSGISDSGKKIPIDNVGKWFAGTPGYAGHVIVENFKGNIALVKIPEQSPLEVFLLLYELKRAVEGGISHSGDIDESRFFFRLYDVVLEAAKDFADTTKKNASNYHRAAFANSVAYALTGVSGGYGGPSIREYAAGSVLGNRTKNISFSEAVQILSDDNGVIFGPITDLHRRYWRDIPQEEMFDNDPDDLEELKKGEYYTEDEDDFDSGLGRPNPYENN